MLIKREGEIRIIGALCLLIAMLFTLPVMSQADDRPNIVVVLVDDMRWDDYGAGGHPFVKTPNIDRLAAEGVQFINAFATTPLCSPSRATFLTGLYARNNGIIDNTDRGGHDLTTFPLELQKDGYDTAFVGKWHMGTDGTKRPGFNTWVSMIGQGANTDPELIIGGTDKQQIKGHVTDVLTDQAVKFLESKRDDPFLLYFAQKAVHPDPRLGLVDGGFIAADRHIGMYDDFPILRSPSAGVTPVDKPALMRKIGDLPPLGFDTSTKDITIRQRLEMITGVDESVGRLMKTLEKSGELDNTVFVVASDHGYFYGEHGLNPQRRLAYEESARIPIIIRYPKLIKAGSKPEQLILSVDLAPTLLEIAGNKAELDLDGRSLMSVIEGKARNWRKSFLIEFHSDPPSYLGAANDTGSDSRVASARTRGTSEFLRAIGMGYKAVRTERYKYIKYTTLEGMDELYDLKTDPYELKNLINESKSSRLLQRMQTELSRLDEET
jgi:N-acetylglucosamine-6-sulfatase